jgi:phospholipid-binding lipoprotein MlaA
LRGPGGAFNDSIDRWFLRPVAKGYDWITPAPVQRGVGNMFANMYDFNAAINGVLQWRWAGAAQSSGRFLVNSTVGLLGVFDVATTMGISPYRTDFGHTLAIWGFESGPYLMVPLFGPRTIRSGTGTIFDTYTSIPTYIDNVRVRNSLWGLELIDGRARLLNADELVTGDRYIFIRDAYLQGRETFVNDGVVQDDFSDFGIDEDWEEF